MNNNPPSLEEIERYWGSLETYNEEQRRCGLEVLAAADLLNLTDQKQTMPGASKTKVAPARTASTKKFSASLPERLGQAAIKVGQWLARHSHTQDIS